MQIKQLQWIVEAKQNPKHPIYIFKTKPLILFVTLFTCCVRYCVATEELWSGGHGGDQHRRGPVRGEATHRQHSRHQLRTHLQRRQPSQQVSVSSNISVELYFVMFSWRISGST